MEKLTQQKPAAVRKLSPGKLLTDLSMPILLVLLIIVFSILSDSF